MDKAKFLIANDSLYRSSFPSSIKKVKFVNYNIEDNVYDSLSAVKDQFTILVRKKWFWKKSKIWTNKAFYNKFLETWELDDLQNPHELVFYGFSKPIFSENQKYAVVNVSKKRRCSGVINKYMYMKKDDKWIKIYEMNGCVFKIFTTHISCKDRRGMEFE